MNFTSEQLKIIHSGLGLQWFSYVKQLDATSDTNQIRYLCQQLVETITLYQRIDEVLNNEV